MADATAYALLRATEQQGDAEPDAAAKALFGLAAMVVTS